MLPATGEAQDCPTCNRGPVGANRKPECIYIYIYIYIYMNWDGILVVWDTSPFQGARHITTTKMTVGPRDRVIVLVTYDCAMVFTSQTHDD